VNARSVEAYGGPLFIAWQLTNRCAARCLACCEDSGPDRAWDDELSCEEALNLAQRIADSGTPYVAFGGGEPLGVPHSWELFERLVSAGVALKLETDGRYIDEAGADRLVALAPQCIQISVDGATAATHERVRPGSNFAAVIAGIKRLTQRGYAPQLVFVPSQHNIHEVVEVYELAVQLGCEAFVSGPLMRIGRAAAAWTSLACDESTWQHCVERLHARARALGAGTALSIYPWDILTEIRRRRDSPQAMLLIVPNGKVKLLNALPFAPADLRRDSLEQAWRAYREAWRSPHVSEFIDACWADPRLLRYANETWPMERPWSLASPQQCG
jgi:MoaA/NifB/PqqE/SkfB family radical SAM enzyme